MRVKFTCYPKGYEITPYGSIVQRTYWTADTGVFHNYHGVGYTKEQALESLENEINKRKAAKHVKKIEYWEDVNAD